MEGLGPLGALSSLDYGGDPAKCPVSASTAEVFALRAFHYALDRVVINYPPAVRVIVIVCAEVVGRPQIPHTVKELYARVKRGPSGVLLPHPLEALGLAYRAGSGEWEVAEATSPVGTTPTSVDLLPFTDSRGKALEEKMRLSFRTVCVVRLRADALGKSSVARRTRRHLFPGFCSLDSVVQRSRASHASLNESGYDDM